MGSDWRSTSSLVIGGSLTFANRKRIAELALQYRAFVR